MYQACDFAICWGIMHRIMSIVVRNDGQPGDLISAQGLSHDGGHLSEKEYNYQPYIFMKSDEIDPSID